MRWFANSCALIAAAMLLSAAALHAADVDKKFHDAPASVKATKNPYEGDPAAPGGETLVCTQLPVVPREVG